MKGKNNNLFLKKKISNSALKNHLLARIKLKGLVFFFNCKDKVERKFIKNKIRVSHYAIKKKNNMYFSHKK